MEYVEIKCEYSGCGRRHEVLRVPKYQLERRDAARRARASEREKIAEGLKRECDGYAVAHNLDFVHAQRADGKRIISGCDELEDDDF